MLNFNKCIRMVDRIKNMLLFQCHSYSERIKSNDKIQKLLLIEFAKFKDYTEDDVWDFSTPEHYKNSSIFGLHIFNNLNSIIPFKFRAESKSELADTQSPKPNHQQMYVSSPRGGLRKTRASMFARKLDDYYHFDETLDLVGDGTFGAMYKCAPFKNERRYTFDEYSDYSLVFQRSRRSAVTITNLSTQHLAPFVFSPRTSIENDQVFVVQKINKSKLHHFKDMDTLVRREMEILEKRKSLQQTDDGRSNCIFGLVDVFEDEDAIHIVSDYCIGDSLWIKIEHDGIQSDDMIQTIGKQTLEGLLILHSEDIAHLDLNPDHIIFMNNIYEYLFEVKLLHFGMSRLVPPLRKAAVLTKNIHFVAPEVLKGVYDTKSDIWSLGILLFMLQFGYTPFFHGTDPHQSRIIDWSEPLFKKIQKGFNAITKPRKGPWFPKDIHIMDELKDLIAKMLETDLTKRLSASQCLKHPYFQLKTNSKPFSSNITESLKLFSRQYHCKLMLEKLYTEFKFDEVTLDRIKQLMTAHGNEYRNYPIEAIQLKYEQMNYTSVVAAFASQQRVAMDERLWETFRSKSRNHDGRIDITAIQRILLDTNPERFDVGLMQIESLQTKSHNAVSLDYEEFLSTLYPEFNQLSISMPEFHPKANNDDINPTLCYNVIIAALKYYQQLDLEKDEVKLLIFFHETYTSFLDDYIYLVSKRNAKDKALYSAIKAANLETCDLRQCSSITRHYRDRTKDGKENAMMETDDEFVFYRDIMDQIHCIIYHDEEHDLKAMKERSNKFTINVFDENQTEETFIDGLYIFISDIHSDDKSVAMIGMISFEEYDSDAIHDDIVLTEAEDGSASNIKHYLDIMYMNNSIDYYKRIKDYLYDTKLCESTFSIGFRFYYWDYYRNKLEYDPDVTGGRNENHHLGFKPSELFVKTKYKSLKDEICDNKIFSLRLHQYKLSLHKTGKYYFGSEKVKQMVYKYTDSDDDLHYGYPISNYPISFDHLFAICLYCDWTDLSTAFSATFRKKNAFESISSVINRNTEIANWSRLLRETVELYGMRCPRDEFDAGIKGPFYCGMDNVMVIPEFNIRLNGPTSTSTSIEVAARFGGDDGIIIQLNNNGCKLRAFGCSFISNYASEGEWLFCGGRFGIKVESIILQSTEQSFQEVIAALFYFDSMLNGTEINTSDICDEHYLILDQLIRHKLQQNGFMNSFPKYINDTFTTFLNHKKQLIINLHDINNNKFKMLYKLIMYSSKDQPNILRQIIFELMPNVKCIVIYSAILDNTNNKGLYYEYPFNLAELFDVVLSSYLHIRKDIQITIKATQKYAKSYQRKSRSWLFDSYYGYCNTNDINAKLCIKLKEETSWDEILKEDWLIITIKR